MKALYRRFRQVRIALLEAPFAQGAQDLRV